MTNKKLRCGENFADLRSSVLSVAEKTAVVVSNSDRFGFVPTPQDYVVYPSHGVGRVLAVEESEVAGNRMELIVISFEQERMILRVPVSRMKASGIRPLSSKDEFGVAMEILKGRARIRRVMWARRAQEYETKINSGDIAAIAEVVRDLYKGSGNTDQSYSERQLFEAAFERLSRELAAIENIDKGRAADLLSNFLEKKAAGAAA